MTSPSDIPPPDPETPHDGPASHASQSSSDTLRNMPSENTLKAYKADWTDFARWCRMHGSNPLPPSGALIGRYMASLAVEDSQGPALSPATIERRLAGLVWNFAQRGVPLDKSDRHIASALTRLRHKHPPVRKETILADDIRAMVATLPHDLRGLRDRAILLLGFAGGLRRSEIVRLRLGRNTGPDDVGIDLLDGGAVLTLTVRKGAMEIEVGRGSSDMTCPVHALEQWLHFAKITEGPVFRRTSRDGKRALETRLSDKHVARLIKSTVLRSGIRADLPENERIALYAGQSLRTGMAIAAREDGHNSARHLRRPADGTSPEDRFKVNLTKAAGL